MIAFFPNVNNLKIKTKLGYKNFGGISFNGFKKTLTLFFQDGTFLSCTPEHKIFSKNKKIEASKLKIGSYVDTSKRKQKKIILIENDKIEKPVFDILNVEDTHSFFANEINISNCIILDEFAHIDNNLAETFFRSTYPAISSGQTTKIFIVSTPKGMNLFYKLWQEANKPPAEKTSKFVPKEVHWSCVPGRDEEWMKQEISNLGGQSNFDQEHGGEFLGSDQTLISGSKLRSLVFKLPLKSQNNLDVFQEPIIDTITNAHGITTRVPHQYVLCADTAQGKELDYSAFVVIDVTEIPYKIVAKYKSNVISTINFPDVIYDVARRYNNAFVLIEVNDGRDVAQALHYDLEYENILKCTTKGRAGQVLSTGYSKNPQYGLKMSTAVKKIGCANLKALIESDKLLFIDFDIISQLATFVRQGNTYKADLETGAHDDLVMSMVLFAWLVQQKYFKELLNSDLRMHLHQELEDKIMHEVLPAPYIFDGLNDIEPEEIGGMVWYEIPSVYNGIG